ncbi:MAG: sigma-54 dependent transcriptional regulator [Myxococcota bacterium]|nr:sigma-54 dependent transcriptional regulator [Myxococcota bacterium]
MSAALVNTVHILVADDEENLRTVFGMLLRRQGYVVTTVEDGHAALEALESDVFSVLLTDLRMPGLDGLGLLKQVTERWPKLPVVILTAHGTVDVAVEALKRGAFDFISKGCDNDDVLKVIAKAVATRTLASAEPRLVSNTSTTADSGRFGLIGQSSAMQVVFDLVERVADTPSTVLISGESGTGKELVARALHEQSSRRKGPFIRVNCAAIPDTLIESELFGYERGAFTGAFESKPGRFELASGGTLFLDEIGEISTEMQVKLLRAIQESEFERVGGVKTMTVDVRLIAATNRDLSAQVNAGLFREDLFYRLNVVPIRLPALRDRADDIAMLVEHILQKFSRRLKQPIRKVDASALTCLMDYGWPGNIRELENVLERTLLLADGETLTADDFPSELRDAGPDAIMGQGLQIPIGMANLKETVRHITRTVERRMIVQYLQETGGNVTQTARRLGISRKSLQTKMKDFGLREESSAS